MKSLLYILSIILISCHLTHAQKDLAKIRIEGTTQKRIDKYTKTYKIKKRFDTTPLGNVNATIHDGTGTVYRGSSDSSGTYDISFHVLPNKDYTIQFSKNGYFPKYFQLNTNGISSHKEIHFKGWDFHLFKRVIGLSDSIFILPTKFYYDSERGYMTYDEEFNTPLVVAQEEAYLNFQRSLNEVNYVVENIDDQGYSVKNIKNKEEETNEENEINVPDQQMPEIQLLDMKKLLSELEISEEQDELIENKQKEISNEWQQLELAKVKAVTESDKNKILEAQKMLMEKENQIKLARSEIDNTKKQLELKAMESKNKTTLLMLASFAFILVFVLMIVLYRNNKERKKINGLITQKNKEVIDSIKYAQRLQNAILPPDNIIAQNLKKNFILYLPKDIVSGDFYWIENIGKKTLFAVVDCTGHGVPGAFMSIISYNALNQAINEHKLIKPADILTQVNIDISKTLHQAQNIDVEDGMDISLCLYDSETHELQYAGAHHSLNLIREGSLKTVKGDKFSLGSQKAKDKKYTNHNFQLNKGDYIYVFSDGYADQFGGKKERKFMYKRLRDLLASNCDKTPEVQKQILEKEFHKWKGNLEQVDDVCVMGVNIV